MRACMFECLPGHMHVCACLSVCACAHRLKDEGGATGDGGGCAGIAVAEVGRDLGEGGQGRRCHVVWEGEKGMW